MKLRTHKEELQQRNRIGTTSRETIKGLNQFYSYENPPSILMQLQKYCYKNMFRIRVV